MKKLFVLLFAFVLIAAACGGSDDEAETGTDDETSTETAEEESDETPTEGADDERHGPKTATRLRPAVRPAPVASSSSCSGRPRRRPTACCRRVPRTLLAGFAGERAPGQSFDPGRRQIVSRRLAAEIPTSRQRRCGRGLLVDHLDPA